MKEIKAQISNALMNIELPNDLVIKIGNGSFSDSNATFKLEVSKMGENGTLETREARDFLAHCVFDSDLKKEWLNTPNNVRGKQYTIIGYKRANRKYPFLVTSNGKTYKMSLQQVLASWN